MSCCVPRCRNDAHYKCARCNALYCSVPCYRAHSDSCVQAFSRQASSQLAGITASETEVARFNALLNRLRRDPQLQLYSEDDPSYVHPELVEQQQQEGRLGESESDAESDAEEHGQRSDSHSSHNNEPHVLEQLLNCLDDEQKKAFFSIFNSSMERAYGSGPPPRGSAPQRSMSTGSSPNEEPESISKQQGITETLEELVQDIEHLNLSHEQMLARLPRELVDKFHDEMRNNNLQETLKPWRPWWQLCRHDDDDDDDIEEASERPRLPKAADLLVSPDIPQKNASTLLMNSVVDVLHSICATLRLYDGDCFSDPFHAAKTMWTLSSVLSADGRYRTVQQACRACFETTCRAHGEEMAYVALEDVAAVLGGCSDWVTRCLFYGQNVLKESRNEIRVADGRKAVKERIRKVAYMVSWTLCQQSSLFRNTAREVGSFVEMEQSRCEELGVARRAVELVDYCKEARVLGSE